MRKIKFRAWDKCNERMIEPRNILKICMSRLNQEPYLIVYLKKWMNPNMEIREIDKCYTNEFELMQYTGFADEGGKEIYEGDIVEFIDYGWNDDEYNCVGEVIFEDGAWHITNSISTSELFNYDGEGIRVIGSIYENPELLEREP